MVHLRELLTNACKSLDDAIVVRLEGGSSTWEVLKSLQVS